MKEFHQEFEALKSEVDTYLTFLHSVINGNVRYITSEDECDEGGAGEMIETETQKVLKANFFFFYII
jgi:hypothetical protein